MKKPISDATALSYARITGALYLIIFIFGLFSEIIVRSSLIVPGDADATAANVLSSEWLFRLGFAGDLIIFLCDVAVAVLLYMLLMSASKTGSMISAAFRLTGTAIYGVNLLNYFAALLILKGAVQLGVFDTGHINALALMFLNIHKHGYDLGLIFFGVHCVILGYLIRKSDYFPNVLGVLMFLAGLGYLIGSTSLFLWPELASAIQFVYIAPIVGELSFCLWLLIKGVKR